MSAPPGTATKAAAAAIARWSLPDAGDDRLYYAQVREDARLELEVLQPAARDSLVVVSSGGCTALSLLAAGAGRVAAVDCNRVQNHLVELKLLAVRLLPQADALAFLGAQPGRPDWRVRSYAGLAPGLTPAARAYWDLHHRAIAGGLLNAGVTERFIRLVVAALRLTVHSRARISRLLACRSVEAQQEFFAQEWNTWRWRTFFRLLLNRAVFRRAYDPAFFQHVENPSFPAHFRACADHAITRLSIAENYFLHHMLAGIYPAATPGGLPEYLTVDSKRRLATAAGLTLVDAGLTSYLRTVDDASVTGFVVSNICERLPPGAVEELFAQMARTAVPGARVCLRNFVGWTDVPAAWRKVFAEDSAWGERLMARDRSVVNRRFTVCTVGERKAP